ncbi:MAG: hypothetical protein JG781_2177, partial [Peptococcaceae bacterium]|nr:hypothetical protein [Peptococcaceae bacterium]
MDKKEVKSVLQAFTEKIRYS